MTPTTDSAPVPNSAPLEPGLRCPECDYDLTGLTEHRCPECGKPFDPERLRDFLSGKPMPIPGWDNCQDGLLIRFSRTCLQTWFEPRKFAKRFPWCYRADSASSFWFLTHFAAMVILILQGLVAQILAPGGRVAYLAAYIAIAVGVVPAATICEALVVLLLRIGTRCRVSVPQNRADYLAASSWWGLVNFFSSYLVLSTAIVGTLGIAVTQRRHMAGLATVAVLFGAVFSAWWWLALVRGVLERTIPTAGRVVVCLLIPLAVIAGMIGGSIAAQMCLFGR